MSLRRSRATSRQPKRSPTARALVLFALGPVLLMGSGCRQSTVRPDPSSSPPGGTSVLYWHLDGDSPADQVTAAIRDLDPDIAILELEQNATAVADNLLADSPRWREWELLPDGDSGLTLISTCALLSAQSEPEVPYRMTGEERRLRYGILDVTVQLPSGVPLRVLAVSAKDKTFDPAGQSEMRRNELRLVARHARQRIEASPGVQTLLVGALNDIPGAAGLRGLTGGTPPLLQDVRPQDASGDAWTTHDPETDQYLRNHYLLIRPGTSFQGHILDQPQFRTLSRHRPLWITPKT